MMTKIEKVVMVVELRMLEGSRERLLKTIDNIRDNNEKVLAGFEGYTYIGVSNEYKKLNDVIDRIYELKKEIIKLGA